MSGMKFNQINVKMQNSQLSEDEMDEPSATGKSGARASYLPAAWEDDTRMNALFTEFRARNANTAGYDNKMKFWVDVIDACVVGEDMVTFSAAELREKLQRKGKKPHCIPAVLEEMHRSKKFITMDQFFAASQESWVAWGFDSLVKKPFSFTTGLLFGSSSLDGDKTRYISLDLVKAKAADVVDRAQSGILPSSALDLATFNELFGDIVSGPALPVVLKHLQRTQQAVVTDLDNQEHATIKFLQRGSASSPRHKVDAKISEADRGVIAVRRSLKKMEDEAAAMHTKVEELDAEVRSLVRAGKKPVAIRVLKKKKLLEKALAQKDVVITNLGNMLFKLENSESDTKVFETYKAGLSALKKTQQDTSLEKIESIVDDIQEAVDIQNEIDEALRSPLRGSGDDVDEDELDRELKDLLEDDATGNLIAELESLKVADNEPIPAKPVTPAPAKRDSSQRGKTGFTQ
ncbi:putative Charged multivesicular body protein 7 [Hypsibius exemplaris]|uniref:Charged multivesicular body protein 7 n=1 Tax=Hypsibius exemplaris TaxID=2072580 RepID=A0A1W0WE18_HYPEX|nr:putative Charged multivesicular body protein 7 [Hypsibius exemplaris]